MNINLHNGFFTTDKDLEMPKKFANVFKGANSKKDQFIEIDLIVGEKENDKIH